MKEKKNIKINVLIIEILVIIVMAIFTCKFYNEKVEAKIELIKLQMEINNLDKTVSNLQEKLNELSDTIVLSNSSNNDNKVENQDNSVTENTNNKIGMSFSDLMDFLYIKDKAKGDGPSIYYKYLYDSTNYYDISGTSNISGISILNRMITIINKDDTITTNNIEGIDGEIVSIKIDSGDEGVRGIAFLTREGNVYYLKKESIDKNDFSAKKIPNLSQVVKIDIVTATAEGAFGAAECLFVVKYDGSFEGISSYELELE